jgi:hypothetical protein
MELGHYQLEVLISAGLLVCMVIAALMCDLLKGKNEQLREMMVELKVRNEEAARREQMLLERPASNASHSRHVYTAARVEAPNPQPLTINAEPVVSVGQTKTAARKVVNRRTHRERTGTLSPDAVAAIQRGVEMAVNPKSMAAKMRPAAIVSSNATAMDVAVASVAISGVSGTAATPSVNGPIRIDMPPAKKSSISIAHVAQVSAVESGVPTPVLQAAKSAEGSFQGQVPLQEVEMVVVGNQTDSAPAIKKNWGALLTKTELKTQQKTETGDSRLLDAIVAATNELPSAATTVPAGYHDGFVLTQLIKSHQPLSGLVVSIGVTGELTPAVSELVRSLLGPADFGCRSATDEFLLIYPNERGAAAQRKLSSIAQQLWSFQLSALGECSIVFSWGGVEVRSEAVEMAIASANDRMQETRRGRNKAAGAVPNVHAA